jgi:hypothetical protein
MLPIKEARKELRRVGTSRAEGDALRYMYANLLAFHWGMSRKANSLLWPIPVLYEHLGSVPDDEIEKVARQMMRSYSLYAQAID